ncbi:MAG: glycerol kinase GlpK [Clostridia bacterium]|nr:glycerol kinase GlpK [Clostridia bacterium]
MAKYIMALDSGTTSNRCILFNAQSEIISVAQKEFTQIFPKPGWVEHNAGEIWATQLSVAVEAMQKAGAEASDIAAIGITNQRETTVLWDKRNGKPVYNAIVWQCRRTAEMCEKLKEEGLSEYISAHTGLVVDAYFSATKIKWILDNVEGARQLAEEGNLLFGTIDTWLIWNLTNGRVHVTDYSNASRTMLFDVDRLCWDEYLYKKLDIPMSILPRVAPSSEVYGAVAQGIPGIEALAGIPICSAIGDQPAALFGQACFHPGQTKNTYGTGCFLLMNTGKRRVKSENKLVTGIAWGLNGEVEYDIEGSAFNAGSVIQWLRDEMNLIKSAPECDRFAESVPDSNGIYLVPAFTGLGAPYWDMYARACVVGMTRGTNKKHLCRAVLESITFQMKDLLEAMRADSNIDITELRVDGGASISDIMMQIQADMINTPVNRPKCVETTALGAAYLAGLAIGFWSDLEEIEAIREVSRVFEPKMSEEERTRLYAGWKRAVERAKDWVEH